MRVLQAKSIIIMSIIWNNVQDILHYYFVVHFLSAFCKIGLPSRGEHLRCGIDISNIYIFTSPYNHTKRFTCGEHLLRCGIDTSIYIAFIIINTLLYNRLSQTTAHPRNRATAQFPQGLGSPLNSLLRLLGKPPTRLS